MHSRHSGATRRVVIDKKYAQVLTPGADGCFELEANQCYVFQLRERIISGKLSGSNIYGMATAKSSVGRADVIARLIVDGMRQYEYLNPDDMRNSTGEMYLEIIPISFNVRVKPGTALSQLRLFYGDPDQSLIKDKDFIKGVLVNSNDGEGYLSVDLSRTMVGGLNVTAYRADVEGSNGKFIDLWKKDEENQKPDPCESWCFAASDNDGRLMLKSNSFYLLRSRERIALPSRIAVYARPMDETLGEMRIHYAGFAHPFFGMDRKDHRVGTPLIFEVRAHSVNVNLDNGERLAKLAFYRMSEQAIRDKDPGYNDQELELSAFFGKWSSQLELEDLETGRIRGKG